MQWLIVLMIIFFLLFYFRNEMQKGIKQWASSREEFIKKFTPIAQKIAKKYGMDYKILVAQAALETGWGRRVIDNNFFNIKATKEWKKLGRDTVKIGTYEYKDGKRIYIEAEWKTYSSPEESIEDFIRLIRTLPRYSKAWLNRDNYLKFFEEIHKAGYATDPLYSYKLRNIYESIA